MTRAGLHTINLWIYARSLALVRITNVNARSAKMLILAGAKNPLDVNSNLLTVCLPSDETDKVDRQNSDAAGIEYYED